MSPIPELEAIRKAQILEAGLQTIAERGCANVTMDDICRAAGLSKGGLAHYYRSKYELFKSVFKEFFARIFAQGRDTMDRFDDPLEKVLSFRWIFDLDNPDLNFGYPLLLDFMAICVHDAGYREIFHDWIGSWVSLLSSALEEGIARGQFAPMDVEATARTISSVYQGVAVRWYLDPKVHTTAWAVESMQQTIQGLLSPYIKNN